MTTLPAIGSTVQMDNPRSTLYGNTGTVVCHQTFGAATVVGVAFDFDSFPVACSMRDLTPATTLTHPLDSLTDDGATHTLPDGRTLRVRILPDHDYTVAGDGDWFGAIEPVTIAPWSGRHDGRPAGFDGAAVIITDHHGDRWWWQAPADVRVNPDSMTAMRACLVDALTYGASVVMLDLCDGTDAFGAPIVRHYVCTGSVLDAHDPVTLRDVLGDLLCELCDETDLPYLWDSLEGVPGYVCGRCGDHYDGQLDLCPSCRTEWED
jgi:hypothetical protein